MRTRALSDASEETVVPMGRRIDLRRVWVQVHLWLGLTLGVVGALVGSSIAASSNYYNDGYYGPAAPAYGYSAPAPAYGYAPAPSYGYYAPPPYYYAAPVIGASIVYSSGPRYYGPRHYYRGHRHW